MKKGFEIALIFLTAILKWILVDGYGLRVYFIPAAFLIWVSFIIYKATQEPNFFANAGFNQKNLKSASLLCAMLIFSLASIMGAYGKLKHFGVDQQHLLIAICIYPIWGFLQQFIVMRFVAVNLQTFNMSKPAIILITALAFGAVHIPVWPLFGATFLIGLPFTALYIKYKNLWPLGITHGVLGAFFYFYVLNEDPIAQIINSL